jgi:hypothetical protein
VGCLTLTTLEQITLGETTSIQEQRLRQGGELMLREAGAYRAGAGALLFTLQMLAQRL